MKVEIDSNTYISVNEIKVGYTFMYDDEPFMVISLCHIVGACPNCAETYSANQFMSDGYIHAVNISTGVVAEFHPTVKVTAVSLKVVNN